MCLGGVLRAAFDWVYGATSHTKPPATQLCCRQPNNGPNFAQHADQNYPASDDGDRLRRQCPRWAPTAELIPLTVVLIAFDNRTIFLRLILHSPPVALSIEPFANIQPYWAGFSVLACPCQTKRTHGLSTSRTVKAEHSAHRSITSLQDCQFLATRTVLPGFPASKSTARVPPTAQNATMEALRRRS